MNMPNSFKNLSFKFRSYILAFTFFVFCFATLNFSQLIIEGYNRSVESGELSKQYEANSGKKSGFFICDFGEPKQHIANKFLNFTVFFISLILLFKLNFWRISVSLIFQFLSLLHFGSWFLNSYVRYSWIVREFSEKTMATEFSNEDFSFPFRYLQLSNRLDFIVLASLIILIFWQVSILYSFVNERFQAKISFK